MPNKSSFPKIDIHTHVALPEVLKLTKKIKIRGNKPGMQHWVPKASRAGHLTQSKYHQDALLSPKLRLKDMDAMGIDIQVIGMNLPTPTYWANSEIAQEVVRQCNNSIAEFVSQYPNRYIGIGSVPLQNQTLTIKEMDYLVSIGLKGITIPSHVRSKDIGIKKFKKFWQKAEELQLPVYIHPRGFTHDERLKEYFLWNSIGQPLEEALAMASIIYEGILDDFPKLQIIIAHGGGYLPYYSGRTDKAYDTRLETRQNISNKPSAYFSKFYYDTVIFDQNMLIPLIKKAGHTRVMLGSDYPRGEIEHNPVEFITTAKMLSKTIKNDILGLNAAKLFKIKF